MEEKYILYGAGHYCKKLCEIIKVSKLKIIAIVDSDQNKWGMNFEGYIIESPSILQNYSESVICITVKDDNVINEIRKYIKKNYPKCVKNEISYYKLIIEAYKNNETILQLISSFEIDREHSKKFLFDCSAGLVFGGVENWTIDICKKLIQNGLKKVYILSDMGNYIVPSELDNHIFYLNIKHDNSFSECNIINILKEILSNLPCKIITRSTNEVMLAAYLIKRYYPDLIEVVSPIHNSYEEMYKMYEEFLCCSDIYIGVSQDIIERMIKLGVTSEKLYLMHIPFDCKKTLSRSYSLNIHEPLKIGYAGRMEVEQKRMDLLLKLIKYLSDRNINFIFNLAGNGTYLTEMKVYLQNNNLENYVQFFGQLERSQMLDFWKQQDICVNIADYEGRSISITEAMGSGAVPIVTATSGVKEDIRQGKNGYIVPIGSYCDIAKHIEYFFLNREMLCTMGKLAHDAVLPKSYMKKHIDFWKEILFA